VTVIGQAITKRNSFGELKVLFTVENHPYFILSLIFFLAFVSSTLLIVGIENFKFIQQKGGAYLKKVADESGEKKLIDLFDKRPEDPKFFDLYLHSTTFSGIVLHIANALLLFLAVFFSGQGLPIFVVLIVFYSIGMYLFQRYKNKNVADYKTSLKDGIEEKKEQSTNLLLLGLVGVVGIIIGIIICVILSNFL
jgi:small-conductance mechanosensitive channel